MLLGGAAIWQGFYGPLEEAGNWPRWVAVMFGVALFNGGIIAALMDRSFDRLRKKTLFTYIHVIAIFSSQLSLLLVLNWTVFIQGFSADDISGWIIFGIPTLLMDIILVYAIFALIFKALKKRVNAEE